MGNTPPSGVLAVLEPGSGIVFTLHGTKYLAMVTAVCPEELDPRYGVPHYLRYISGQCAREWVWLDVGSKMLSLRPGRDRCAFEMESTGLWRRDVTIPTIAWTTSELESVRSSRRLCDYLEAEWPRLGLPRDVKILELGAGDGWLGMTVARNLVAISGRSTTRVTDQEGYRIRSLSQNVAYNVAQGLPLENLGLGVLDWEQACPDVTQEETLHLLIGADVVEESSARHLARTIRDFLSQKQEMLVLLAHQMTGSLDAKEAFVQALQSQQLEFEIVAAESPQASLEQEAKGVVIWQITCQKQDQWLLPWSDSLTGLEDTFYV